MRWPRAYDSEDTVVFEDPQKGPSSISTWREKSRIAPAPQASPFSPLSEVPATIGLVRCPIGSRQLTRPLFKENWDSRRARLAANLQRQEFYRGWRYAFPIHTPAGPCLGKSEGIVVQGAQIYVGEGD